MSQSILPRDSRAMNDADRTRNSSISAWTIGGTILVEVITCILRFGLRLESTRDTASTIGVLTYGLRIHHGYIGGLLIVLACWGWMRYPRVAWWTLVIGLSLLFSDFVHHFLVLWPITGSPQFDLFYSPLGSLAG